MSGIQHLKCLAAVKSMGAVRQLAPGAFPGNHCPLHTALSLGSRIRGLSTLVIGTAECGYYSRNIPAASPWADEALHWTYLMSSKEIVFSCRQGLIEAIRDMDEAGAKAILLLVTCVPELTGEDIEGICYELQPQRKAALIPVFLGNFKCGSYQPGYWKTLLALGALAQPRSLVQGQTRENGIVNILGRSSAEAHILKPRLLAALETEGMGLRYLGPDASLEDFQWAGDAKLSLVLSPFLNPLAQRLEEEQGIPFISLHELYEPEEIKAAYAQIESHLAINFANAFKEDLNHCHFLQSRIGERLEGKHYIGAGVGAMQILPLAVYLSGFGLSPIMLNMEEFYPSDKEWRIKLLARKENPIITLMVNEAADQPLLQSLGSDLILGDWGGRAEDIPPTVQILDLYGQIGYERTILLMERLKGALDKREEENKYGLI